MNQLSPISGTADLDVERAWEHQLLDLAAQGDEASAAQLYELHVDSIYRCASRILGRSDGDVEDVVQQTFLAALAGAHRFDGRSKVSTWLVGIATRRALDQVRSRSRRQRWSKVRQWVGLGRPADRPDQAMNARDTAMSALSQLNAEQRAVFVLRHVEGYTYKEISEMTGTGISTLHARDKAARVRLDAHLSATLEGAR